MKRTVKCFSIYKFIFNVKCYRKVGFNKSYDIPKQVEINLILE